MRERRWETSNQLEFSEVLSVGERLASWGLAPAHPAKDIICYIEEWIVEGPEDFDRLDPWNSEDVTLVRVHDGWQGDFFLLAGGYHTVYQRHRRVGTYCSVCHPWRVPGALRTLHERGMFWVGFRHHHGFIRVRLHTTDVIAPGETRVDDQRDVWVFEREQAFMAATRILELPISAGVGQGKIMLKASPTDVPFFCSWPDSFGPCQFEYNTSDPFEFLVPAGRLAATYGGQSATVRAYLTGFSEAALKEFQAVQPEAKSGYRCSVHCPLDELPEVLEAVAPSGRVYATLCEFQTEQLCPEGADASAVIGVVGGDGAYRIEVRLNRAPLDEADMAAWLEQIVGHAVTYAPLPPFP